jgi:hypothetical protein
MARWFVCIVARATEEWPVTAALTRRLHAVAFAHCGVTWTVGGKAEHAVPSS